MSDKNLLVSVFGKPNSGKTSTWCKLFGQTVKTGTKLRRLYLTSNEYVEVFLVSGSPEERGKKISDILPEDSPRIVLCSIQYADHADDTFNHFVSNGYQGLVQWLNPGFSDKKLYSDDLEFSEYLLSTNCFSLSQCEATSYKHLDDRVQKIREFIYGWAKFNNLLVQV